MRTRIYSSLRISEKKNHKTMMSTERIRIYYPLTSDPPSDTSQTVAVRSSLQYTFHYVSPRTRAVRSTRP